MGGEGDRAGLQRPRQTRRESWAFTPFGGLLGGTPIEYTQPVSRRRLGTAIPCAALWLVASLTPLCAGTGSVRVTFGHTLSDFTGPVPFGEARVAVDPASGEALVGWGREVRVFNEVGMQVHKFATSMAHAGILDLVATASGDLFTAALDLDSPGGRPQVVFTRHDFRGVPLESMTLTGLPDGYTAFLPNRVFHHGGRLIAVDTARWLAVFAEPNGRFTGGLDLGSALGLSREEQESLQITGITVDPEANFLLTCSTLFRAFVVSPEGVVLASWGEAGSVPGSFGVVSGIARDRLGRTFVADKNRGVVMVFDPAYRFITEFGGDRSSAGALGLPSNVVIDDAGRIYVTQVGKGGVGVYIVASP